MDKYQFYVVEFLEQPLTNAIYSVPVCWIVDADSEEVATVKFPAQCPSDLRDRVKNKVPFLNDWDIHKVNVKYGTDVFQDSLNYIEMLHNVRRDSAESAHGDEHEPTNEMQNLTSEELTLAADYPGMIELLRKFCVSLESNRETMKQIMSCCLKGSSHVKTLMNIIVEYNQFINENEGFLNTQSEEENQGEQDVAQDESLGYGGEQGEEGNEQVNNIREQEPSNNKGLEQSDKQPETPINVGREKLLNLRGEQGVESNKTVNYSGKPEAFKHKGLEQLDSQAVQQQNQVESENQDMPKKREVENKIQKHVDSTQQQLETENRKQSVENAGSDKGSGVLKENEIVMENDSKKRGQIQNEYYEHDSKWTLKYRTLTAELVELMPNSGIYVHQSGLTYCHRSCKNAKQLAGELLGEVFSNKALRNCSLTRKKANEFKSKRIKPSLDQDAVNVIIKYTNFYARMNGWISLDKHLIMSALYKKLRDLSNKLRNEYYSINK